jgi:acetylornithine/succinyldiaminopimelate/putrescine aminotransferase/predicted amino acid dehydrogenase/acyl carrier protein
VLTALAAPLGPRPVWMSSLRRGSDDRRSVLQATAGMFVAGAPVDPSVVMARGRRIALPASVREPRRIWFSDRSESPPAPVSRPITALADVLRHEVAAVLRLDAAELDTSVPLRRLGLDSLLAVELVARLEKRLGRSLVLEAMHQDASIDGLVAQAGDRTASPPETFVETQPGAYADYVRPATMAWLEAGMLDKVYVEARGDRLVALDGGERVEILDAVGGFGCTLFGHNHPALVAHQIASLERAVPQHAQGSQRAPAGRLARELSSLLGEGQREFVATFVNSGAEAVELAVKHAEMEYASRGDAKTTAVAKHLARLLHDLGDVIADPAVCDTLGLPPGSSLARAVAAIEAHNAGAMAERPVFLAVQRSFHGKTSGAARLTARATHRTRFSAGLRVEHVAAGSTTEVAERARHHALAFLDLEVRGDRVAITRHPWSGVAALFLEPVQGEGGVWPLTPQFLAAARRAADDHGFPVVVDEIQTGFGRCGAFSAAHALGLRADYYLFGKALGGGLAKIATLMVDRDRYVPDFGLNATSTFAEDDLSTSTALAALDLFRRDGLERRALAAGQRLLQGLEAVRGRYPEVIAEVRGLGLLIGIELTDTRRLPSPFLRQLHDEIGRVAASWLTNVARVRTLPTDSAPGTIRLEPSAYVSTADQDRMIAAIERLAEILDKGDVARLVGHLAGHPDDPSQPVRDWRHARGHPDDDPHPGDARVAFVTYFTEDRDLVDFCPALSDLPAAARETLVRRIHRLIPPRVVRSARVHSSAGSAVHVDMIGLVATSGLIEDAFRAGDVDWVRAQIDEAIALGAARGATVVGLGGLTSIVTHNGRLAATRQVALTTGNALTVAMGVAAVEGACRAAGVDVATATVAIVGAAGNIGSSYAASFAGRSKRLLLIGREGSNATLTDLAAALGAPAPGRSPAVAVSEDLYALRTADVVIAASNSTRPIIEPEHLRAGPVIICDVAVPPDVSPRVAALRPDVRIIPGGAVRLPADVDLDLVAGHLPPGHVYACMAETMLLGLDGATRHGSFGPVRHDDVVNVAAMAERHGFRLGLADDTAVAGPVRVPAPMESDMRHGPRLD